MERPPSEKPGSSKSQPADAGEGPPPPVAERDDVRVEASAVRCPYCHEQVDVEGGAPWVACGDCLARHHDACWEELGVCGTCGGTRRLVTEDAAPEHRGAEGAELAERGRRTKLRSLYEGWQRPRDGTGGWWHRPPRVEEAARQEKEVERALTAWLAWIPAVGSVGGASIPTVVYSVQACLLAVASAAHGTVGAKEGLGIGLSALVLGALGLLAAAWVAPRRTESPGHRLSPRTGPRRRLLLLAALDLAPVPLIVAASGALSSLLGFWLVLAVASGVLACASRRPEAEPAAEPEGAEKDR